MIASNQARANQKIVVTDGDALYIEILRDLLVSEGYSQVLSPAGADPYELIRRELPALVLIDIHVGQERQAWELLFQMRRDGKMSGVAVLICSTDWRLLEQQTPLLRRLSCDALAKPFALDELVAKVFALIGPPLERRSSIRE
jgi:DNA-binding response OmpR family regulator